MSSQESTKDGLDVLNHAANQLKAPDANENLINETTKPQEMNQGRLPASVPPPPPFFMSKESQAHLKTTLSFVVAMRLLKEKKHRQQQQQVGTQTCPPAQPSQQDSTLELLQDDIITTTDDHNKDNDKYSLSQKQLQQLQQEQQEDQERTQEAQRFQKKQRVNFLMDQVLREVQGGVGIAGTCMHLMQEFQTLLIHQEEDLVDYEDYICETFRQFPVPASLVWRQIVSAASHGQGEQKQSDHCSTSLEAVQFVCWVHSLLLSVWPYQSHVMSALESHYRHYIKRWKPDLESPTQGFKTPRTKLVPEHAVHFLHLLRDLAPFVPRVNQTASVNGLNQINADTFKSPHSLYLELLSQPSPVQRHCAGEFLWLECSLQNIFRDMGRTV